MMRDHIPSQKMHSRSGLSAVTLMLIALSISAVAISYLGFSTRSRILTQRSLDYQRARILANSALESVKAQCMGATQSVTPVEPTFVGFGSNYTVRVSRVDDGSRIYLRAGVMNKVQQVNPIVAAAEFSYPSSIPAAIPMGGYALFSYTDLFFNTTRDDFLIQGYENYGGKGAYINGNFTCWATPNLNREVKMPKNVEIVGQFIINHPELSTRSREDINRASREIEFGGINCFHQYGNIVTDNRTYDSLYIPHNTSQTYSDWVDLKENRFSGDVKTGSEVSEVKLFLTPGYDNRTIIEPWAPGHTAPAEVRDKMFAYRARTDNNGVYLKVNSDKSVSMWVAGDPKGIIGQNSGAFTKNGDRNRRGQVLDDPTTFVRVHDNFYDPREKDSLLTTGKPTSDGGQQMLMTDIWIDQMITNVVADYGVPIKYLYVEVDPSLKTSSLQPAVRLRSGWNLTGCHTDGFSVATHCMAYVEGHYNADGMVGAIRWPALIASDNLTGLSNDWEDSNSQDVVSLPKGSQTRLNAAILIGGPDPTIIQNTPGYGTVNGFTMSGRHLLRLREDFDGGDVEQYYYRGSYLHLWDAEESYCLNGDWLGNKGKQWLEWDVNYATKAPPGMPNMFPTTAVTSSGRNHWKEISWATLMSGTP